MLSLRPASIALVFGAFVATASTAAVLPVLEDFPTDNANWTGGNPQAALTYEDDGGPDGGAYVTTPYNYNGFVSNFGVGPVIFRANSAANASDGAFAGNWIEDGVGRVRAWVRQDTGIDLTYYVRFATASGAPPGAVVNDDDTVPSGVWTQIEIVIDPNDPSCQGEGNTCAEAMATVGTLQIGTDAPAPLPTTDESFTLGLDKVELLEAEVPEPGQAMLAVVGALVMTGARRRRRAR